MEEAPFTLAASYTCSCSCSFCILHSVTHANGSFQLGAWSLSLGLMAWACGGGSWMRVRGAVCRMQDAQDVDIGYKP